MTIVGEERVSVSEAITTTAPRYRGLVVRMVAAAVLDRRVYEEVSGDSSANGQALLAVVLAGAFNGLGLAGRLGGWGLSAGIGAAVLGWFLWTVMILGVGRLLGHRAEGSLLRALAFTNAPGVMLVFGIVPIVGPLVRVLVVVWQLVAAIVAIQAVLRVPRGRSVMIAVAAFLIYLLAGVGLGYWAMEDTAEETRAVSV